MATVTTPNAENPKNPTDLNSTPPTNDNVSSARIQTPPGGDADGSKDEPAVAEKKTEADNGSSVTDIQKKMKRAERFGMPVQLSEEEKRNSRAERFGTDSAVNGLNSSKQSEDIKRKARAERFGMTQSLSADEEAKKQARLARFDSSGETDSLEEEKKKARAIRSLLIPLCYCLMNVTRNASLYNSEMSLAIMRRKSQNVKPILPT